MVDILRTISWFCVFGIASGCTERPALPPVDPDQITQVSVINALMVGRYDGVMPITEMLRHGDFGVGTLDHLDGELILLDGKAYQVRGDGVVVEVSADRSTPFAVVTTFEEDGSFTSPEISSLTELDAHLDDALPQKNNPVAIRVEGRFASITLRSVQRQEPPYRPLAEVAKEQRVWTHENQVGTLVGIRSPAWGGVLNVPGYHWHFLSDDRKVGGHVLDCRGGEGRGRYDVCQNWLLKLDGTTGSNEADLGQDLSHELHKVESSRSGASEPSQ